LATGHTSLSAAILARCLGRRDEFGPEGHTRAGIVSVRPANTRRGLFAADNGRERDPVRSWPRENPPPPALVHCPTERHALALNLGCDAPAESRYGSLPRISRILATLSPLFAVNVTT
jgi:hypothetical protein